MIVNGQTKKMFSKKLFIEKVENLRVLIHSNLDELTVVLEEKSNMRWYPVLRKDYNGITVESFDFIKIVEEVMKEYVQKKTVEQHISNIINNDDVETIVLPNVEVD